MRSATDIFLIGPRGCGKTTIGRQLAARWGDRFIDLDDVAMRRFTEPSVHEIWSSHGEAAWRDAEVAALAALLEDRPPEGSTGDARQVVALGGGTPVIEEARALIDRARRAGRVRVVYLRCRAAELVRRLRAAPGDRPSLTGRTLEAEVASVLAARSPVYEAAADIIVEADEGDPSSLAAAIGRIIEQAAGTADG